MPDKIEGFEIAAHWSDGEVTCAGCWDKSEHNLDANTIIPKGDPIYLQGGMTDCGEEWDAYCQDCAREKASETYEDVTN